MSPHSKKGGLRCRRPLGFKHAPDVLRLCGRRGRGLGVARGALDVAGGGPLGQRRGVVAVFVVDYGVQPLHGLKRGLQVRADAGGSPGFCALAAALGVGRAGKGGDGGVELLEKIGGHFAGDEVGLERRGIGGKGAGGGQHVAIGEIVGQAEFVIQSRRGLGEGDSGFMDGHEIVMQPLESDGLGVGAAFGGFPAGNLRGGGAADLGHASGDNGEQRSALAGGGKVSDVRDAEVVDAGEHGIEVDLGVFHKVVAGWPKATPPDTGVN